MTILEDSLKNENDPKNQDNLQNLDNLKNKDDAKNEDDTKEEDNQKNEDSPKNEGDPINDKKLKIQNGCLTVPKWLEGSGKSPPSRLLGTKNNFRGIFFLF